MTGMSKFTGFLRSGLSHIALFAVVLASGCAPKGPPNVLIITIDTLRADHVGCYGFKLARTANIDALADQGVRCSNAAAVAPITLPSHCSIMTGLYPPAHGVRDNGAYALGDDTVTLADRLRAAGYATTAIVSAVILNRRYNLNQGFDSYDDDLWEEDEPKLFMVRDRKAPKTAAHFAAWLDAWSKEPQRKPFFAWVHFYDPHAPYEPPPRDRVLSPTAYDGEIAVADRGVGTLISALREKGVLDRTLVVLTADHGESLGEHQEKTHALFIYDATIHVPLIWRLPRVFPAHTVYDGPVSSVDIVPTVLAVLGLPGGDQTQGLNLLRALQGRTTPPDRPQYCESLLSEVGFGMAPLYGVRMDGMKWIRAPRPELYDLRRDPKELHNIYAGNFATAMKLDHELDAILEDSKLHQHAAKENPMDRETLQELRSLGYMAGGQERAAMGGMDPKDGIAIYNQLEDARHLCQNHRWGEADKELREILAKVPTHLTARNILALALVHEGKPEEAIAEYRESLKQDPKQSRIYAALGSVEMLQGDLEGAQRDLERALEITPHFVEAICGLGFVASLRGDEAAAQRWYTKAVAEDPGYPRVYRRIADLYFEKKDYASALHYYQRTLEVAPDDFQALIQAGSCARHAGNAALAQTEFERAAKLRADSWIPWYNLGCLAAAEGHPTHAVTQLVTAVSKGFNDPDLLRLDHDWDSVRSDALFARVVREVTKAHDEAVKPADVPTGED
jgi:choline-sulfatase